jgi:hypothetical protein
MTLEQEIYQQLLELHARDLEVENIGLQLQVDAFKVLKDYNTQPLPVIYPAPQYPWVAPAYPGTLPVWCTTTDTYELGSLEDAEKFAQSRNYQYETK